MKNQVLFSSKDKSEKCRLLQFLFGAFGVKLYGYTMFSQYFYKEGKKIFLV